MYLYENYCILIKKMPQRFAANSPVSNIVTLSQIMGRRREVDHFLSEPMLSNLVTLKCFDILNIFSKCDLFTPHTFVIRCIYPNILEIYNVDMWNIKWL